MVKCKLDIDSYKEKWCASFYTRFKAVQAFLRNRKSFDISVRNLQMISGFCLVIDEESNE